VTDQEYPFPHQCPDRRGRYGGEVVMYVSRKPEKPGSEGMIRESE
jgi:hypothetical protein